MEDRRSGSTPWLTGLSARLLILTMFFVMLSEVFIYAPSIGRYRLVYMEERIAAAHLASLALDVPSDQAVSPKLMDELLDHARSRGIVLRRPRSKALLMSSNVPPRIDATYDLAKGRFFPLIWEAFLVMARTEDRVIRVIGKSPKGPGVVVETIIDEAPMRIEMYDYSGRILLLSLVISFLTASLVYLSLHWLFVRPMLGITDNMVAFRANPEDAGRVIQPGRATSRRAGAKPSQRRNPEITSRSGSVSGVTRSASMPGGSFPPAARQAARATSASATVCTGASPNTNGCTQGNPASPRSSAVPP